MKRRFAILNMILMAVVLFTTAWHSVHAFSHEHFEHSKHQSKKQGTQFIALDHEHEHCTTCDFHFDYFIAPQQFCLRLDFPFKPIPYSVGDKRDNIFFSGSLFALRAPPALV